MRIIIAPAKKMNADIAFLKPQGKPVFLDKSQEILKALKSMSYAELKQLWGCNDKLAKLNYERISQMDLADKLAPALLSYEGIQYQYMASKILDDDNYDYLQERLRILSGFYGVLRPFDGITPYRLEMQADLKIKGFDNLYDYWGDCLYREVIDESHTIINLASKEYSKCIERYLKPQDCFITIIFAEMVKGKLVQKGTYAKMARGVMVHYLACQRVDNPEDIKKFSELNYGFDEALSDKTTYVFIKKS